MKLLMNQQGLLMKLVPHQELMKPPHQVVILDDGVEDPLSYKQVMNDVDKDQWVKAMDLEMKSMYFNSVWELVDLPERVKSIGCIWIYKRKRDLAGKVQTFKARLVAKWFTQREWVYYEENFSPIAMLKSIRILLSIATFYDYEIWQMDVKTGFLNGNLEESIFMSQPEGFITQDRKKSFGTKKKLRTTKYNNLVSRAPKHVWTKEKEDTLVECLMELVSTEGWKSDNGMFRPGYLTQLSHPIMKGLLNKPFPYYDELAYMFGCDRAMGRFTETLADESKKLVRYEGFDMPDGNEEFSSTYNQGIHMSQEDVRISRPTMRQTVRSDRADRRGREETSGRVSLKSYIWPLSVQMTNSGRLSSGLHAPLPKTPMFARNSYAYCVRCQPK
ncbi:gag/pol protein [Cucumis melo var. makuwa]|uniref:Gag/pol protein n=1 Tax=Cucumis melo var. makuwa TaxID=1194695 RepID=A0A5A7THW0_CUCMM|nr:gag/pol protein [Cucumis melo var. makuwa]